MHVVIHKQNGRPKGRDHVNGIEGFWSQAKHLMYPLPGVRRRNFHLHLGELAFRFNHRDEDLLPLPGRLVKRTNADELTSALVRMRKGLVIIIVTRSPVVDEMAGRERCRT